MTQVTIDIQRTGFPVTIGTIEFWFDTRVEHLSKFLNIEQDALKKKKELLAKVLDESLKATLENGEDVNISSLSYETVLEFLDYQKAVDAFEYDSIFGDGTYEKLYAEYGDVIALHNTLWNVSEVIADKMEKDNQGAKERMESARKKYTRKK